MASSKAGEVAVRAGSSPKGKWIFSKEEMLNMASLREGMDEFKELQFRQQSTKFIQLLGDRLNQNLKDTRGKITQLCMCAAMIHMHRFFYFHSFTFFDYRDVAAACLFLSGKSEECPRKIDHIVRAWWSEKFPGIKLDQQKYDDAMGLLVAIESMILQTIAFDLQVALPHPLVLKAMHTIAKNNRKITEVVYFFSTDVLCVTSWGIRYSAEAIAVACVYIVCTWAEYEIPAYIDGVKWYHKTDPTMTEDQLAEMMVEFVTVYRTCRADLAITKFIRKGDIRDPISDDRATPPALAGSSDMLARLPPPPPPPTNLGTKKVDINAYKERRAADGGMSGSGQYGSSSSASSHAHHQQQSQHQQQPDKRRSFMPEMNQKGVTASMPGFVPPRQEGGELQMQQHHQQQQQQQRRPDGSRDDPYRSSSSSSSQRPPSNGGSGSGAGGQSRSSSHHYPPQQQQMQQQSYGLQQPSSSSSTSGHDRQSMDSGLQHMQQQQQHRQSMGGERGSREEREREKRKREMSSSSLHSDKRSRIDMQHMSGGGGGPPPRGHSMMSSSGGGMGMPHQQQQHMQQQQGSYNNVPPPQPLMQQQPPNPHYGKHQQHQPQQPQYAAPPPSLMSNGHHQQQLQHMQQQQRVSLGGPMSFQPQQQPLSGYGSMPPQPGYGHGQTLPHLLQQNGYHMGIHPPPPPPVISSSGNDLEDGEVY